MTNLITVDDVRLYCLGKAKFDTARFEPFLESAELDYIKPFLGVDFYDDIQTQYLSDTLSVDNALLVNSYLKRATAWHVLAKALPFLNIDITNSGLQRNNSEFSTSGTKEERADLVNASLANGQLFLQKAKDFLEKTQKADTTKYPLYSAITNIENNTNIIGGIILDIDDEEDINNFNFRNE